MPSSNPARSAFAVAIGLLFLCAALVFGAFENFAKSERWLQHTQQVREALGESESDIAAAARERLIYVLTSDADALARYRQDVAQIAAALSRLRQLTADNPAQQRNCDRLENLANTRIQLWEKSIALKNSGRPDPMGQPEMTRQSLEFANDIVGVMRTMGAEEFRLLKERTASVRLHLLVLVISLLIALTAALLLLVWHYHLLRRELQARKQAEQVAHESELKAHQAEGAALLSRNAAAQLSTRLLNLQDEERRRLSRELHDSIGQYLAAAKMVISFNSQREQFGSALFRMHQIA